MQAARGAAAKLEKRRWLMINVEEYQKPAQRPGRMVTMKGVGQV
jgi:hypothetical protein